MDFSAMDSTPEARPLQIVTLRLWLPDRPGALGDVASRIGSVGGDVVGIEILERGAGLAVDDLSIELGGETDIEELVRAVNSIDGVNVEHADASPVRAADGWLDATETAAQLMGATSRAELVEALCERAHQLTSAAWTAVVELSEPEIEASCGDVPSAAWLAAFVEGRRAVERDTTGAADASNMIVWAPLAGSGLAVVQGRTTTSYRIRERRRIAGLARIAGGWLGALGAASLMTAMRAHPSNAMLSRADVYRPVAL